MAPATTSLLINISLDSRSLSLFRVSLAFSLLGQIFFLVFNKSSGVNVFLCGLAVICFLGIVLGGLL